MSRLSNKDVYNELLGEVEVNEVEKINHKCILELDEKGNKTGRLICVGKERVELDGNPYDLQAGVTLERKGKNWIKYDEDGSQNLQQKLIKRVREQL